jgi:CBS domain-containing protein
MMDALVNQVFFQSAGRLVTGEEVCSCSRTATLREVVTAMARKNIGSIVIVEEGRPVGIFTERDFLKKIAAKNLDLDEEMVGTYMSSNPVCVTSETQMIKVMSFMRLGRFRHLVLTDTDGKLVGVISVKDVLSYVVDSFNDLNTQT